MMHRESSVRSRELGRRLLSAQQRAGFNGFQLAEKLEWSASRLSRTMTGLRAASDIEVATILGLCGVIGDEREAILQLSRPYEDTSLRLPADEHWPVYLVHASEAVRLCEFQPLIVPWMLQTPDYTRALIVDGAQPTTWEAQIAARRVAVGLLRRPRVDVFIHEWALRTPPTDCEDMMSDQLHHLLRLSVRPEVSLRVVPRGRGMYSGQHGGFTLLEFRSSGPALYRADHVCGMLLDNHPAVATYQSTVRSLDVVALGEEESRGLISEIAVQTYGSGNGDGRCVPSGTAFAAS